MNPRAKNILDFWFIKSQRNQWFEKNNEYDLLILKNFMEYHIQATRGDYLNWINSEKEALAYIILIDQFSRNMFRNNPKSYKYDYLSLNFCKYGIKENYLKFFTNPNEIMFYIMPLIHSENIQDQELALEKMNKYLLKHPNIEKIKKFFERHKEIILIFKRFPHRNKILGRKSTEEEIDFLKTPFSSF